MQTSSHLQPNENTKYSRSSGLFAMVIFHIKILIRKSNILQGFPNSLSVCKYIHCSRLNQCFYSKHCKHVKLIKSVILFSSNNAFMFTHGPLKKLCIYYRSVCVLVYIYIYRCVDVVVNMHTF